MKRDANLVRLSRDHNRALVVAVRIQREAPGASSEQLIELRSAMLGFWRDALLPHFRAECECVLTRLARRREMGEELLARTQSDHLKLNTLAVAIDDGTVLEDSRRILLEMAALLRDHIRWEEAELFERAQLELSADELQLLGDDLAQRIPEIPAPPPWSAEPVDRSTAPGGQP